MTPSFNGYLRPDGQVGIRNRLLVLFTVVCAEEVSRRVAMQIDDAVVAGWRDCMSSPMAQTKMLRLADNPNVGAVLVMSLGCECSDAPAITAAIGASGKSVALVSIQDAGGTRAAIEQGVRTGRALMEDVFPRQEIGLADLIVGVECGGSDTTSGLAANPAVGVAADRIVAAGGTVIFEETNELLGCEEILTQQSATPAVAADVLAAIQSARAVGGSKRAPGNKRWQYRRWIDNHRGKITRSGLQSWFVADPERIARRRLAQTGRTGSPPAGADVCRGTWLDWWWHDQ